MVVVQRLDEVVLHELVEFVSTHIPAPNPDAGPDVDGVPRVTQALEHVARVVPELPVPHDERVVDIKEDVELAHVGSEVAR